MACRRSIICACSDDRWQDGIQEGCQDGVSLLEAGLSLLRGTLSVHACMTCVLVKVEPTGLANIRSDQEKGFDGNESGFGCFALQLLSR